MIGSIVRSVGAVILALVVAMIFATVVEVVSAIIYPFPPGADTSNCEVIIAYQKELPAGGFLIAIVGWSLAAFASSWVATRLGASRHPAHGIGIGAILIGLAVVNMSVLAYPIYFWVSILLLLPAGSVFGMMLVRARPGLILSTASE